MSLIYDIELPELITAELQRLIAGCEVVDLLQLARKNSDLIRGFQAKESNAKIIRQRLQSRLKKSGELDLPIIEFIAEQSLNRQFICVLSLEALQHCFDELMVTLGTEPFILGLLFDKRLEVRDLALDYLENPHDSDNDLPQARTILSEKLEQYIDIFSFVTDKRTTSSTKVTANSSQNRDTEYEAKIDQLTAQLEASKCNRKEVNILNKKMVSLDDDYRKNQLELDKLKNNFLDLKSENRDLEQVATESQEELALLRYNQDEIVKSKVATELEQASNAWLQRPLEVDEVLQQITAISDDDILSRADDILKKQFEQDRHYGNVRILTERLQLLQAKSKQLLQAQQESIKPVPELNAISREITTELNKLNKLLGLQQSGANLIDECTRRINSAETASDIADTESMLVLFTKMKLLPDDELNKLYLNYHARLGTMMAQYNPSAELTDNALWWFYKLLRNNKKIYLLLDGYNILHLLSSIFSPFYENDIPAVAAREQLIERMIYAVANYPHCHVNIFFDSPEPSEYSPATNVKVTYSGGGDGEHRADTVLLGHLQFLANHGYANAAVVITDDRDIQVNARNLKAKILSTVQFAGLLNRG